MSTPATTSRLRLLLGLLAVVGLLLAACGAPKPVAIRYGEQVGDYCGMMITDPRYGSQIVTRTGKTYTFDSVECLVGFMLDGGVPAGDIHSVWVTDFAAPGTLIPAEEAYYLKSPSLRSPMAVNLTAFARKHDLEEAKVAFEGLELAYADLANVVRQSGFLNFGHGERPEGHAP